MLLMDHGDLTTQFAWSQAALSFCRAVLHLKLAAAGFPLAQLLFTPKMVIRNSESESS
jgi:hypothetical protein